MEEIFLEVELREELGRGKVKDLRDEGFIPGIIYGGGQKSQAIKVSRSQLLHLLHEHRLENAVLNLKLKPSKAAKEEKEKKVKPCLIKEVQHDPVKGDIIHVDFNEISLTKVIKVNVSVAAKGEPVGVKQEGGSLEHILWEVEVECLPKDIPQEITVDVSHLKIGDAVHIKEIVFPAGIKVLSDPEATVLSVAAPIKEEVAVAEVEGEEKQEPEVIKEKKEVPAEEAEKEEKEKK